MLQFVDREVAVVYGIVDRVAGEFFDPDFLFGVPGRRLRSNTEVRTAEIGSSESFKLFLGKSVFVGFRFFRHGFYGTVCRSGSGSSGCCAVFRSGFRARRKGRQEHCRKKGKNEIAFHVNSFRPPHDPADMHKI